jgi:uncharacterized lipoprotein YddW (UPF0748 family)
MSFRSLLRVLGVLALLLGGCSTPPKPAPVAKAPPAPPPPAAPREFRGVWVATVANIDWPSKPGLPVAQQRAEIIAILDRARALKLNAVILQVRPSADALYPSALEPWSEYLTGVQGRPPSPLYDPLQEWIIEAHKRGLELHAWFNPYRARHQFAKSAFAPDHIAKTHPEAVKHYGDLWWMDPGEAIAAQRTLAVVEDVVRRYDVDGVHIDDYFYPYPIPVPGAPKPPPGTPAPTVDFPDGPSWKRYRAAGGKLDRADWRRENVNQLVEQLNAGVHAIKPWVKFGVSPFGLGRPDRRPPGIDGFSQYDKLYADVELWLQRGWLDYLAPQLYWRLGQKGQDFGTLADYWARQNTLQRHLWPGLFTSAIGDKAKAWTPEDILGQVALLRADPRVTGQVHFSMAALQQDLHGVATKLAAGPYAGDALVPTTPWLDAVPPPAPQLQRQKSGRIDILPAIGKPAANYAVWRQKPGGAWQFSVQPAGAVVLEATADENVVVSAVDRLGNESPRVTLPGVAPKH